MQAKRTRERVWTSGLSGLTRSWRRSATPRHSGELLSAHPSSSPIETSLSSVLPPLSPAPCSLPPVPCLPRCLSAPAPPLPSSRLPIQRHRRPLSGVPHLWLEPCRNNNSSRFGKFTKVHFDEHGHVSAGCPPWLLQSCCAQNGRVQPQVSGASIIVYLLEKSRVVAATEGERNYHCFYQVL